ncbi:MAG: lactonase family protein [Kiritimatiellaeota bacterium]|nr:lactonase family protein [Kiritimatiellota bacterium]
MLEMCVSMVGAVAAGLLAGCASYRYPEQDIYTAYVGTYTGESGSKGIYRIVVDKRSGIVGEPQLVAEVDNPSFLARQWTTLYAVSESLNKVFAYGIYPPHTNDDGLTVNIFDAMKGGKMVPLDAMQKDNLTLLNEADTGAGPCHVVVSLRGYLGFPGFVAAADYMGGSVTAWERERNGRIGRKIATFQNTHASKATGRQQQPHAHGVTWDECYDRLLVPDLGADRVYVYKIHRGERDPETAYWPVDRIEPAPDTPWVDLPPGRGPRHVAFTPGGFAHTDYYEHPYMYVLNELSNTICVYDCGPFGTKGFTFVEEISTLPEGFDGQSTAAELAVSEDGRALYASNRGHDSIARFRRDPKTGRLTLLECVPCGGKGPRHFTLMPGGSLMLVANQNSNNIAVFRVGRDGALTPLPDGGADIGAPVCVTF